MLRVDRMLCLSSVAVLPDRRIRRFASFGG